MIATSDNFTKDDFLNDLYLFYRYFVSSGYPNSVPAPHIEELSRRLLSLYLGQGKSRLAVSMPPRHIAADSTPILTANRGWTTHGDLKVGDYVFGLNGKPTKIIGLSPKKECDRLVSFTNGSEILVHEGHLWSVHKRGNREKELQVLPTSEIEKDLFYLCKNGKNNVKGRFRYHLPLIEPIQYDEQELPIDPYWLGLWLGDGFSSNSDICCQEGDEEYCLKGTPYDVTNLKPNSFGRCVIASYSYQGLVAKLKELNLYKNKHIPDIYKKASVEQRKQLLAGLIDSDGNVDSKGRVRFVNVNKTLIDDFYELCAGLALYPYTMNPRSPEKNNSYKKSTDLIRSKQICYCVGFQPRFEIPTKIPRKKIVEKGLRRKIAISDIQKTDKTEMGQCIEVEAENGIYLIGEDLIPTHNSKSSMVTLAFPLWLIFKDPSLNILIVNNSASLSEKFGIQIREYIKNIGPYFGVFLSDVKRSSTHIMFTDKNGNLYDGSIRLVGASGSITGQDADWLVIDDPYFGFDDITPSQLNKKIEWFQTIILQRLEPTSKLIILHTRWHPISKDCPVYTSNRGWINHGELMKGDCLLHPSGSKTKVVNVHPTVPVDNCFVFSNGDKIISGDEHLWKFQDYSNNSQVKLFTSKKILGKNTFVGKSYLANFKIPFRNKLISLIDKYKVKPVPGNCITVDAADGMYLIGKNLTPTHNSNDLIGHVRETDPDNYDFVEFPALDENDNPLWEERFDTDFLLDLKKNVGERVFQSVYQQKPIDATSDFFNMKKLKFGFPEDYVQESIARAWDIASGDQLSSNDFTAGVKMARFGDYAVILDLVHGRFGSNTKAMIQNTAFMDSPQCHVVIETGVAGAGELLYQEWSKQLQGFMVERAKVSGGKSKVDRATPFQNAIEDGKVYVAIEDGPTRQAFFDELNGFPAGEHDDITDACSHVYNYLFMNDSDKPVTAKFGVVYL